MKIFMKMTNKADILYYIVVTDRYIIVTGMSILLINENDCILWGKPYLIYLILIFLVSLTSMFDAFYLLYSSE